MNETDTIETKLAPSVIPHKMKCPCFKYGSFPPSPQMKRGTSIDTAFRHLCAGNSEKLAALEDPKAAKATIWAVTKAQELAAGNPILSKKGSVRLQATIGGVLISGELDSLIPSMHTIIELKSGEPANYSGQLSAYALLYMHNNCVQACTSHTLYCDKEKVDTVEWSKDKAEAIILPLVAAVTNPKRVPTPENMPECTRCRNSNADGQCTLMI